MLAIDWGTSSLRIYRIDSEGRVCEARHSTEGILNVPDSDFAKVLDSHAGDWISAGEAPIVMSGMIGSRQGWKEAAYLDCPAGIAEIGSAMCTVKWKSTNGQPVCAWIAPGLQCLDQSGVSDVMRGEEVQILGIIDQLHRGEHHLCLPGTHSKWAVVRNGQIASFSTYMTGEMFGVLKQHSILSRTMVSGAFDEPAFINGVARAANPEGLLHHLFGVRAQVLAGEITDQQSASYLSGILIGHELHSAAINIDRFHLVGGAELTSLYSLAASTMKLETVVHEADAVTRGLFALTQYVTDNT